MTTWDIRITSKPPAGADLDGIAVAMMEALQKVAGVDVWTVGGDDEASIYAHFGLMMPAEVTTENIENTFSQAVKVFTEAALTSGWVPGAGNAELADPVDLIGVELHVVGDGLGAATDLAVA